MVSGGQVTKVRMEHVWVEAAVDYIPSRAAKNIDPDSWIPLDASFKQYDYLQGLDAIAISGLDAEQLAQDFVNSGTVNETEGWVSGFNPTILENAQTQTQQAVEDHITANLPDPTVGDVIGGRRTIVEEFPALHASLPNPVFVNGVTYAFVPGALQQKITFAMGADVVGDLINPVTFPWAELNNQKVILSFKPATADDEAALLALLPEGEITDISQLPDSIPAYLINVIPELSVNGEVVMSGQPMILGEEIDFRFNPRIVGHGTIPNRYSVIAGSYLSIAVISNNVSPDVLTDLQTDVETTKTILESNDEIQISELTRDQVLGDIFYAGTLGYYAQYASLSYLAGLQQHAYHSLAAGVGSFGYEPNVTKVFGIPQSISTGGAVGNLPMVRVVGADQLDAASNELSTTKKDFNLAVGLLSSALEHAVPEQLFDTDPNNPPDAISAVKAIQKATLAGQRIYQLTQANMATTLPNLNLNAETEVEVEQALNAGLEVITHTDPVSVPGYSGAGYIIYDPVTGDGAYKIGGGGNGGRLDAVPSIDLEIQKLYTLLKVAGIIALGVAAVATSAALLALLFLQFKLIAVTVSTMLAIAGLVGDANLVRRAWSNCRPLNAFLFTGAILGKNLTVARSLSKPMQRLFVILDTSVVSLIFDVDASLFDNC